LFLKGVKQEHPSKLLNRKDPWIFSEYALQASKDHSTVKERSRLIFTVTSLTSKPQHTSFFCLFIKKKKKKQRTSPD